jgi:DMSO/TMAO reductase YedYZ molybdopterin-dependent catalytic subunit
MRIRFEVAFPALLLGGALTNYLPVSSLVGAFQASDNVRIYSLVNKPLNLTRAELFSFPMVSEVARLECVMGIPNVVYNWSGVPLFYLLTLTEIRPEAYKVVTRSSDGFESDLLVEEALQPSTILALGANGTDLPVINGVQGSFRLVVPCKWGYKWVGDVKEIEVVNTDYKGTCESSG